MTMRCGVMVVLLLSLWLIAPDVLPKQMASAPAGQQGAIAMQVSFVAPASAKPVSAKPAKPESEPESVPNPTRKPKTEQPLAETKAVSQPKPVSKSKPVSKPKPTPKADREAIKPEPIVESEVAETVPAPAPAPTPAPTPEPVEEVADATASDLPESATASDLPESAPAQQVSQGAGAHQAEQFSEPLFAAPPKPPRYPRLARKRGREGTVWVDIWLDADGKQSRLEISRSSGWDSLDKSALAAVTDWQFLPHKKNGIGHPSRLRIPVAFSLN
ncbi:energy transducer TonB [Corallincola platygyrae]